MTQIEVVFYQADDGSVPALEALIDLQKRDRPCRQTQGKV
jgi:hypothetical protein